MGTFVSSVGLFFIILGVATYLAGFKERLAGPGAYTWFLKRNRRVTTDMVEQVEGQFSKAMGRLCVVGRWMAVAGVVLFLAGYLLP